MNYSVGEWNVNYFASLCTQRESPYIPSPFIAILILFNEVILFLYYHSLIAVLNAIGYLFHPIPES
jgi:hypothetical protein